MSTIWLGDFRLKQIQQYMKRADKSTDSQFFIEDNAEYTWLVNSAFMQLPRLYSSEADLVIMSGFNDCVYSCAWASFDIKQIAADYAKAVNKLTESYSDLRFYVCSVSPVSSDFPFSAYGTTGVIPKTVLNDKIVAFNKEVKAGCSNDKITYIDCHSYLTKTSFNTRDGVRYDYNTIKEIYKYIISQFKTTVGGTFMSIIRDTVEKAPRATTITDPETGTVDDSYKYWTKIGYNGGLNRCEVVKDNFVLPNCVGYAWGRFYEIIGEEPKLCTHNAEWWWHKDGSDKYKNQFPDDPEFDDGYARGEDPREGAVICWRKNTVDSGSDGAGHVAIVEKVDRKNNIITISESGWQDERPTYDPSKHFGVRTITYDKENKTWPTYNDQYKFQGFIYPPQAVVPSSEKLNKLFVDKYISKTIDPPSKDVEEKMKPAVNYIWQYLGSRGWSRNAVAALCGNIHEESCMMPVQWEKPSLKSGSYYTTNYGEYVSPAPVKQSNGTYKPNQTYVNRIVNALGRSTDHIGYGLTQWTPFTKLVNWCNNGNENGTGKVLPYYELSSQLARIAWEADNKKQWNLADYNKGYKYKGEAFDNLTFKDFTTSTKDAGWLAAAFAYCYERSWFTDWVDSNDSGGLSVAEERLAVCEERDKYATFWYEYIKTLSILGFSEEDKGLKVTNFKIDGRKAPSITASFVVKNAKSGKYILKQNNKKIIENPIEKVSEGIKTFKITNSKIKPNNNYKLILEVEGSSDDNQKFSEELDVYIPQEYPSSIKAITLSCDDALKETLSRFTARITKPDNFGYWKESQCFYEISLIVNGKSVKTLEQSSLSFNSFLIEDKFDYRQLKVGDTVQIGVRVGVSETDLYDRPYAKVSNPVCILNKPVRVFLNKK